MKGGYTTWKTQLSSHINWGIGILQINYGFSVCKLFSFFCRHNSGFQSRIAMASAMAGCRILKALGTFSVKFEARMILCSESTRCSKTELILPFGSPLLHRAGSFSLKCSNSCRKVHPMYLVSQEQETDKFRHKWSDVTIYPKYITETTYGE